MTDAGTVVEELALRLARQLGGDLLGLYLFGSLATGGFLAGRSDVDLLAVLRAGVTDAELPALESLHAAFAEEHPDWVERVEVGYVGRDVLQTFGGVPSGPIAVISPGEPLNIKDATPDWTLNWRGVVTSGRAVLGPPPLELGPPVGTREFRRAVAAQLDAWKRDARAPTVKYVPAQQGYIVVTLCRALHALATGETTSKERAVAWTVERYPQWATLVTDALAAYRADLDERQRVLLGFVDFAADEGVRLDDGGRMPGEGLEPPSR